VSFQRVVLGESILTNRPQPPHQPSTIAETPSCLLPIAGAGVMRASIVESISFDLSDLHPGSTLSGTFTLPDSPVPGDTAPVVLSFSDPQNYSPTSVNSTITIGNGTNSPPADRGKVESQQQASHFPSALLFLLSIQPKTQEKKPSESTPDSDSYHFGNISW